MKVFEEVPVFGERFLSLQATPSNVVVVANTVPIVLGEP